MTPLPHNPLIWVEDLPEDASNMKVRFGRYITVDRPFSIRIIGLGPGTWKLICLGLQATEDEAREIVEYSTPDAEGQITHWTAFKDYEMPFDCYTLYTALESLRSLITANGWKNPVFLRKEK